MSEFVLKPEELEMNGANDEKYFKNVKEIKVGNGRWKQDAESLSGYDISGNLTFLIEL
jgi:hypothetical protein